MSSASPYPRILSAPRQSFFLFGPRGTGKSTWARRQFGNAHRIDLLDEGLYQTLLGDPSVFAAELRTVEPGGWVVVDEIQRLPSLLNEVHRFIEERRLKFVLCGSSARKLKQAGTNLLAGRAVRKNLYPFVPEELGADFRLEDALTFGCLPVVFAAEARAETLAAYVQTYLKEEIQAEALVRNLPGFARFLPIAALFHGQVLSVAGMAREAGVSRTTVAGYLDILEDTLLAFRLPAYEARLRVRERKHPKLYWIDPGIVRATKRQLGTLSHEERGALFEGWVATLLRAYQEHRSLCEEIGYWAPTEARDCEVDFLLRQGRRFIAMEVKAAPRFADRMVQGLRAVAGLAGVRRRVLVYLGERRLRTADGIEVWPLAELLRALREGTLFDSGGSGANP